MLKQLCLSTSLLLAACGQPVAGDGHAFDAAEFTRDRVDVRVVVYPDLATLRAHADRLTDAPGRRLMAWSRVSLDRPACTIHIVDPRADYQPVWIGHEFTHCIHGRWHR